MAESILGEVILEGSTRAASKVKTTYQVVLSLVQVVAVKQLDRISLQGNREFLEKVLILSLLHHPNLMDISLDIVWMGTKAS